MMKKILSLLLCLTMVLGFAVPAVQASGADNVYITENNISDFVVGDNVVMENVVVDGQNVGTPPSPTELMSNTTVTTPMETPAQPAAPESCDCDSCVSIEDHTADCVVRASYHMVCAKSAENLMAVWADYSAEEQAYMLRYMQENLPDRYTAFMKLLNAPTGSATETYVDGTTVSVEGIPEDGSVTIQEAADEVKEIVEAYAAENSDSAVEVFSYDISVQDSQGADWQPEETVKMELEVPGKKLHKYDTVYVVHVDDDGNASTIEASVTEDGKIAFETPSFSTFAGFTVDFEYDGQGFSMVGLESVYLSELMDNLKMPLCVEDVIDATFTDSTLICVEKQGSDWLLTSLKAFQTSEYLTVTMNSGEVYEILVTDRTNAKLTLGSGTADQSGGDGVVTWQLDTDGTPYAQNGWSATQDIYVTGPGVMEIHLQNASIYSKLSTTYTNLKLNLRRIVVRDGATLVFRLGGSFKGADNITILGQADVSMFDVLDGTLLLRCSNTSLIPEGAGESYFSNQTTEGTTNDKFVSMVINAQNKNATLTNPIIYLGGSASNFYCEDVIFRNSRSRAVLCRADALQNLSMKDCTFESTVTVHYSHSENGGGAIRLDSFGSGSDITANPLGAVVDIYNFVLDNCKFDSCEGNNDGGAIESMARVYKATIKDSLFQNFNTKQMGADNTTEYAAHGGAVAFKGYMGTVLFDNTQFKNCVVNQYGGAVYFESVKNHNNNWSEFLSVTFQNCYFYKCISKKQHGGAISVNAQMHTLQVLGCKFEECQCLANGGAISIKGKEMPSFNAWQASMDGYGPNNTFKYQFTDGGNYYSSVNTFLVDDYNGKQTEFLKCKASTSGGAIEFAQNTYVKNADINDTTIQGCKAVNNGSAIFMSSPVVESFDFNNVTVKECSYIMGLPGTGAAGEIVHAHTGFQMDENGQYIDAPNDPKATLITTGEAAGTIRSTGATTSVLTMTNCTVTDNYSYSNGGGLYWNACYNRGILEECYATVTKCTFARNISGYHGGGIYCESKLTIQGCQIYDNYADMYGGGIAQQVYNNSGRLLLDGEQTNLTVTSYTDENGVVTETNIYNNYSDVRGGGISIRANPTASILVPKDGEEIVKHAVIFNLQGANIYDNTARLDGGGVSFMEVRDSTGNADAGATWTDEQAIEYNNAEVASYDKSITITNGIVHDNVAGVTQNWANNINRNKKLLMTQEWESTFTETETEAGGSGGGIYMHSTANTTLAVNSGDIYLNTATRGNGGGIFLTGESALCTVTGGTIGGSAARKNVAQPDTTGETPAKGNGGGIAIFGGSRIEMTGGTVSYNEAYVGGGIAVRNGSSMLADKASDGTTATISYNKASSAGGGIAVHDESWMVINGGTVSYNSAVHGGGISLNTCYHTPTAQTNPKWGMEFNGGIISNNTVTPEKAGGTAYGGGICLAGTSSMKLDGGTVSFNKAVSADGTSYAANQEGGGIAVCQTSYMEIKGGDIMNNNAYDGGGMVLRGNSTVIMSGSMTVNSSTDTVTSANGTIKNNTAVHYGGGVYIGPFTGSDVNRFTLTDGWIYQNKATAANGNGGDGGGVYVARYNGFYLNGGRVEENGAARYGGGVYCYEAVTEISDGVMKKNEAASGGGGVYISGSGAARLTVTGGSFLENKSKLSGGGIYAVSCKKVEISNGHFEGNLAKWGGGAFLDQTIDATFSGQCTFTKNYSNQGAGIFIRSSKVDINGGTFSYNKCVNNAYYVSDTKHGGGVLVDNMNAKNYVVTLNGGTIEHNEAPEGGGMWIKNINSNKTNTCPVVVMNGGTIQYNKSTGNGGGVYVDGYNNAVVDAEGKVTTGTFFTMNGGTITNNTASGNGGGVYVCGKAVTTITKGIVNNKEVIGMITYNTGRNGGGVFVTTGGDLTVNEGHITFNKAVGMPASSIKSAYQQYANLKGTGGGIAVANAASTDAQAKFTLTGTNMAIYGNTADFAADDVYANGYATLLDVPQVASMNLTGYNFKPEAWFEDYSVNDNSYSYGTNLGGDKGVVNGNVLRYRGAASSLRIQITEANVTNLVKAANKYICMTLGIPAAVNDIVVSDFGLQMKINVIENDVILSSGEIISGGVLSKTGPSIDNKEKIFEYNGVVYGGLDSNFKSGTVSLDLTHGTAELNTTTGQIIYKLKTSTFKMDSEDTFHYAVFHLTPNATDGYYYYGQVTVVPATTIYYEDNCGGIEYINGSEADDDYGTWKNVKDSAGTDTDLGNKYQGEDRPGAMIIPGTDTDYIYGYDALYKNSNKYSAGGAKFVRVTEGKDASAVFTFKGTGFDVISLSSGDTGSVMVSIYEGDKIDSTKLYETTMVDTYYGCTTNFYKVTYYYSSYKDNAGNVRYNWLEATKEPITEAQMKPNSAKPANPKEGDSYVAYESRIETDPDGNGDTLYQVPVIHRTGLEYGTYTVELYIGWTWWLEMNRPNYDWMEFYLDAIRVYDPADNGNSSETVMNAYKQDAEGWPVYREIRNYLISADQFSNITDGSITGAVVIDGNPALSSSANNGTEVEDENDPLYNLSPEIVDYANFGPNNEVYLQHDQAIAFHLDSSKLQLPEGAEIAAVRLGIKSTNQDSRYKIYDPSTTTLADAKVVKLWTTTDMFYDITEFMDKDVVIYCDTNAFNTLSITDLKITFTENPYGTNASGEMNGEIPGLDNLLVMSARTAQLAVASMETPVEEAPVPVLTPKYPTLSFEGEISYNFYFTAENLGTLTEEKLGLMVFDTADAEGNIDTCTYALIGAKQEDGMYVMATEGIAAKNLGDKLYFKLFAQMADGSYVYSKLFSYSAVDYAKSVLNSATASAKQKTLVAAMLRYGAEAQNYFGHNTDSLMDSILTEDHLNLLAGFSADSLKAVTPADSAKVSDFAATETFGKAYPTVSFEGAFQVQYYFAPEHQPAGEVTMYYWSEDTYASCETLTDENADEVITAELADGQYVAVSPEIAAKELDQTLYVAAVYESEGVSYCSGVLAYSLAAYCKSHANDSMGSFATAAAVYGCAAKNYFEQ